MNFKIQKVNRCTFRFLISSRIKKKKDRISVVCSIQEGTLISCDECTYLFSVEGGCCYINVSVKYFNNLCNKRIKFLLKFYMNITFEKTTIDI